MAQIDRRRALFRGAWVDVDLKDGTTVYSGRIDRMNDREIVLLTDVGSRETIPLRTVQEIRRYGEGDGYMGLRFMDLGGAQGIGFA